MTGVLKYALSVSIILGTALNSLAQPTPREQVESVEAYLPVKLDAELFWSECGGWNGAYWRGLNLIMLCEENLNQGVEVSRFIYLHELGHAFTFSRGVDFTRWEDNYEAAADEFAAVMSVAQGHPEDIVYLAHLFEREAKTRVHKKGDPHPPLQVRADTLKCLYLGSQIPWSVCGDEWREALAHWKQELLAHPDSEGLWNN